MLKIPKRPKFPKLFAVLLMTIGLSVGTAFAMTKTGNEITFPGSVLPSMNEREKTAEKPSSDTDAAVQKKQDEEKKAAEQRQRQAEAATQAQPAAPVNEAGTATSPQPQSSTFTPGRGGGTSGGGTAPLPATSAPPPVTGSGGSGGGSTDDGGGCFCEVISEPVQDTTNNLLEPTAEQLIAPTGVSLWLLRRGVSRKLAFSRIN